MKNRSNLLLGGDIFNSTRPDANSVCQLRLCADALHAAGLRIMAIQGQHDYTVPSWTSAVSPHIEHVHDTVFSPCEGITAYGMDNYRDVEAVKAAVANIPENANMLVCHQMFREVFNMEGVWNIDMDWLPKHVRYVMVGDFHEPVAFKGANGSEAWYSGSLYMCNLTEPTAKSFCHFGMDSRGTLQVQRIPIESRCFAFVTINTADDIPTACKYVQELSMDGYDAELTPVVVVNYVATVPGVPSEMAAACGDSKILWLKPLTMRLMTADKTEAVEGMRHKTMSECLPVFRGEMDSEAYTFVTDILTDADTSAVIARYKEKMLGDA